MPAKTYAYTADLSGNGIFPIRAADQKAVYEPLQEGS